MTATWFFKSRGRHANEDYTWHAAGAGDRASADEIIERGYRERPCFALVDDERPGMLLFHDQRHRLVLLVTGLIPADRPVDYRQRPIRVSLLRIASREGGPARRRPLAVAGPAFRGEGKA